MSLQNRKAYYFLTKDKVSHSSGLNVRILGEKSLQYQVKYKYILHRVHFTRTI